MGSFFGLGRQVNRLVKKFSIYWGRRKLCMMPVILMGLGTGSREIVRLKLLYESGKLQSGGPSFLGRVDPSRHHDISLHSTKGYSRHKSIVKAKNNFI